MMSLLNCLALLLIVVIFALCAWHDYKVVKKHGRIQAD
jgi:hypothetical protein